MHEGGNIMMGSSGKGRVGAAWLMVAFALAACGGGGGSSDSSNAASAGSSVPSDASPLAVSIDSTSAEVRSTPADALAQTFLPIHFTGHTTAQIFAKAHTTFNGIALVTLAGTTLDTAGVQVQFKPAGVLPDGTYSDTLQLKLCFDTDCTEQVAGSPLTVQVRYAVNGSSASMTPVPLSVGAKPLPHDVLDAAISRPLNALVMLSAAPDNALYVYRLADGSERKWPLGAPPTALALSPDGLQAAIGQENLISLVDLTQADATPAQIPFNGRVGQLLFDGHGHLEVIAPPSGSAGLHVVDIASGTDTFADPSVFEGTRAKMLPDASAFYALDAAISPGNLMKYSVQGGVTSHLYDAPYWGDYPMCGDFWLDDSGRHIYTACGNIFAASTDVSIDMHYQGQLPLTDGSGSYSASITSLSAYDAGHELALLDTGKCGIAGGGDVCGSLLRVLHEDDLALTSAYWLAPGLAGGKLCTQHGLFVFHDANGAIWLVSHLSGADDPTQAYYVTRPANGTTAPPA
jgi:hypothetical protein